MKKIIWVLVILIFIGLLGWGSFSYFSPKTENYVEEKLLRMKSYNIEIVSPFI